MIRSMTGFGDASVQDDGVHYAVELRSVNNRYFKATVRLPEAIAGIEAQLEAVLRKRLSRGSVTLTVRMHDPRAAAAPRVNQEVLMAYLDHLDTLRRKMPHDGLAPQIDVVSLLALPGVMGVVDDEQALLDRARPAVIGLAERACDKLLAMRVTEGKMLACDLAGQCQVIENLLAGIGQRAPHVVEAYHQRLRTRIDDLLARAGLSVDEKDLIHEVAVFAERADISEEVSRMNAHMDQFQQILASHNGDPAGRTLDFVAQELLREANTIASKSNDAQISRAVVEVKGAIDRIKEQVQNVE